VSATDRSFHPYTAQKDRQKKCKILNTKGKGQNEKTIIGSNLAFAF
jgi:hypothetical protein